MRIFPFLAACALVSSPAVYPQSLPKGIQKVTSVEGITEYKLDKNWKVFARGENILNEHYQEVFNFGTTGPALYAGFNATW